MSKSNTPYFQLVNKAEDKAVVLINGGVNEWGENSNRRISNEISALDKKYEKITFLINSNGGSVSEGIAIYNAIKSVDAETTGVVVGVAASIAFVLLQSFDKRGMRKMTRAMSHKFSGGAMGSAKKLKAMADLMEKWEADVVDEIAEKSGKDKETVQSWFSEGQDKWFTPKEMLDNGLIDFIDNSEAAKAPKNLSNDAEGLYNHYQSAIVNEYLKEKKTENKPELKMKKEHLALIGLSEGASDEVIENKLKELSKNAETADKAKELIENNAKARVQGLIKDGKLSAEQEGFAVNMLVNESEEAEKFFNSLNAPVKPTDVINAGSKSPSKEDRKDWNLDMWMEKDPSGLDAMSDEDYNKIVAKSDSNI